MTTTKPKRISKKKLQEEADARASRGREIMMALTQLEKEKGVSLDVLISAIEEAVAQAYRKDVDRKADVRAVFDRTTGQLRMFRRYVAAEKVDEPSYEILLDVARVQRPEVEIGDVVEREEEMRDFRRISTQAASQAILQKVREAERDVALEVLEDKQDELVLGRVSRVTREDGLRVDLGNIEALLPKDEMVPFERFTINEEIRALVLEVNRRRRDGYVVLSRRHPNFVVKLFEAEIPEIRDGIIEIVQVVRAPGYRTKIVVRSNDRNVEPVGACVGPKGNRIRLVVEKLRGEKIDVIKCSEEPMEFIAYALSPAPVISVELFEEQEKAVVVVPDDSYQLALGKNNVNVRLAEDLTGWNIEVQKASGRQRKNLEAVRLVSEAPSAEVGGLPVAELGLPEDLAAILVDGGADTLRELLNFSWDELSDNPRLTLPRRYLLAEMLKANGLSPVSTEDLSGAEAEMAAMDEAAEYQAALKNYQEKATQLAIGAAALAPEGAGE